MLLYQGIVKYSIFFVNRPDHRFSILSPHGTLHFQLKLLEVAGRRCPDVVIHIVGWQLLRQKTSALSGDAMVISMVPRDGSLDSGLVDGSSIATVRNWQAAIDITFCRHMAD